MREGDSLSILDLWRSSSERACRAECDYFQAHLKSLQGGGDPPSEQARIDAAWLREEATALYRMALVEITGVNANADRVLSGVPLQPPVH